MLVFLMLSAFWAVLWVAIRWSLSWWRRRRYLEPARSVADILRVDYFRCLPRLQLEQLVIQVLTAGKFVLLGDPIVGRSKEQGYAWQAGKKSVVVLRQASPLTSRDLDEIQKMKNRVKAERALVLSPFAASPRGAYPGVEVLSGKKLLSWMGALDQVKPPTIGTLPPSNCRCSAPLKVQVSRAGEPLLVCPRHPDCKGVYRPRRSPRDASASGSTDRPVLQGA